MRQAFSCYDFDDGSSWLRVDVAIECGSEAHAQARALAVFAIIAYPVGIWLAFAALLFRARRAIRSGRHDELSGAISFLHIEYRPTFFWWEV